MNPGFNDPLIIKPDNVENSVPAEPTVGSPEPTVPSETSQNSPVIQEPAANQQPVPAPAPSPMAVQPAPVVPGPTPGGPISPVPPPTTNPAQPVISSPNPTGGQFNIGSNMTPPAPEKSKKHGKKFWALIIAPIVAVLLGGGAYAYYGYYMSPGFVWQQSVGNMNKGYSKLISYLNQQSTANYKGFAQTGTFSFVTNGESFNGSLDSQTDGSNSTISAKLDLGAANLDLEVRSVKSAGNSEPDLYLKLSGITTVSGLVGDPTLEKQLNSLDGKWIMIDHNLIIDLMNLVRKSQQASSHPSSPKLTWSDFYSFLQSAGKVNQEYIFTTNKNTAVTKVVKTYGRETVDGHDTYHYKVGFVPANLEAYVRQMCSTLQSSSLGNYIKQQTNQSIDSSSYCKNMEKSAGEIKSSDTIDVWADINSRLIYKVRFSGSTNPAKNFVDIGLDYTGGDTYPFFMTAQGEDGTNGNLKVSLNGKTGTVNVSFDGSSGSQQSSKDTFVANLALTPSNKPINVTAPTGAESIITVLNNMGLGPLVSQFQSQGSGFQLGTLKAMPPSNLAANHEAKSLMMPILDTALFTATR